MECSLIINAGSSSKKYAVFKDGVCALEVRFEQTGDGFELCTAINSSRQKCEGVKEAQFTHALEAVVAIGQHEGVLHDKEDITAVAVRIVAPGNFFQEHRVIDDEFVRKLREAESFAPLHIPKTLYEIQMIRSVLPSAVAFAISDSAFHKDMPHVARTYAIPNADAEAHDVYRFGYHGISLASVVAQTPHVFSGLLKRMIVCHVGSGVSITALLNGKSMDTTMGYAPGSGLVMGSRAGDVDVDALFALMHAKHMRLHDAQMYLQTQGGLRALYGNSDLRTILDGMSHKEEKAIRAFEHFVYQIRKILGAYTVALGGLDALVLTATACERNPTFRKLLLSELDPLGVRLDKEQNDACVGRSGIISAAESNVRVAVIPTYEIGQMYKQLMQCITLEANH